MINFPPDMRNNCLQAWIGVKLKFLINRLEWDSFSCEETWQSACNKCVTRTNWVLVFAHTCLTFTKHKIQHLNLYWYMSILYSWNLLKNDGCIKNYCDKCQIICKLYYKGTEVYMCIFNAHDELTAWANLNITNKLISAVLIYLLVPVMRNVLGSSLWMASIKSANSSSGTICWIYQIIS